MVRKLKSMPFTIDSIQLFIEVRTYSKSEDCMVYEHIV